MKNPGVILPLSLISLVALLLLSGCAQPQTGNQDQTSDTDGNGQTGNTDNGQTGNTQGDNTDNTAREPQTFTIEFTENGFVPNKVTIKQGDTVTWVNKTAAPTWPASAMHPTHTVYPGSGIEKCGTSEESGIFDACKGLEENETFSFTFNDKGTWGFHDHMNSGKFGQVIVE